MQLEMADFIPSVATWRTQRNTCIIFDAGTFTLLCENKTSSTKLEVHNVLHCHQRRTEPRPQVICKQNFVKFGHVVFQMCKQTDRQRDMLIAILCPPTGAK